MMLSNMHLVLPLSLFVVANGFVSPSGLSAQSTYAGYDPRRTVETSPVSSTSLNLGPESLPLIALVAGVGAIAVGYDSDAFGPIMPAYNEETVVAKPTPVVKAPTKKDAPKPAAVKKEVKVVEKKAAKHPAPKTPAKVTLNAEGQDPSDKPITAAPPVESPSGFKRDESDASSPSVKSLNELKAEVGNTLEKTRAYEQRLETARKSKTGDSEKTDEVTKAADKATTSSSGKKKRSRFRRVIKKVIAPWRKWDNIA